jgi:hypothetical protein
MKQMQKQEEAAQRYYSANPKRDEQKQAGMWNFLPKDQQQFMRKFFGQPDKGNGSVREDW